MSFIESHVAALSWQRQGKAQRKYLPGLAQSYETLGLRDLSDPVLSPPR